MKELKENLSNKPMQLLDFPWLGWKLWATHKLRENPDPPKKNFLRREGTIDKGF